MKKLLKYLNEIVKKHGNVIAGCAFAFVAFTSNSASMVLFHEPKEPDGVEKFKKIRRISKDDVKQNFAQGYPCDDMYTYHQ